MPISSQQVIDAVTLSTNHELLTPTKQFGVVSRIRRPTPRLVAGWTQARGLR